MIKRLFSCFLIFILCFGFYAPVNATAVEAPPLSLGQFLGGSVNATLAPGTADADASEKILANMVTGNYNVENKRMLDLMASTSIADLVKLGFSYDKAKKAADKYKMYCDMTAHYQSVLNSINAQKEAEADAAKKAELEKKAKSAQRDIDMCSYYTLKSDSEAASVIQDAITAIGGLKVKVDYINKSVFNIGGQECGSLLSSSLKQYFKSATGRDFGYMPSNDYGYGTPKKFTWDTDKVSSDLGQFCTAIKGVSADALTHVKLLHIAHNGHFDPSGGPAVLTDIKSEYSSKVITCLYRGNGEWSSFPSNQGWNVDTPIFLYCKANDVDVAYTNDVGKDPKIGGVDVKSRSGSPIYYLLPAYDDVNSNRYYDYYSSPCVGVSNVGELVIPVNARVTAANASSYVMTSSVAITVPNVVPKIRIIPFVLTPDIVATDILVDDFIKDKDRVYAPVISGDFPLSGVVDVPIDVPLDDTKQGGISLPSIFDVNLAKVGGIDLTKDATFDFSSVTKLGNTFTSKFPFSLPWDVYYLIKKFDQPPAAPVFELDMSIFVPKQFKASVEGTKFSIDLTDYDYIIKLIRWFLLIAFVYGLIINTGRLIKH